MNPTFASTSTSHVLSGGHFSRTTYKGPVRNRQTHVAPQFLMLDLGATGRVLSTDEYGTLTGQQEVPWMSNRLMRALRDFPKSGPWEGCVHLNATSRQAVVQSLEHGHARLMRWLQQENCASSSIFHQQRTDLAKRWK